MLVAAAVEVHDSGPGRLRLAPITDFSATSLYAFVKANVKAGATAKTEGWPAYTGAPGVSHDACVVGPMAAHIVLPWTHRTFANLKTWALGVYHGLRRKHLRSTSTSSSSASTAAVPDTLRSDPCSASPSPLNPPLTRC